MRTECPRGGAHPIHHWADGGEIVFTNPQGQAIPTAAQTRSSGNVFSLFAAHQQAGIKITPETAIPDWLGERMDDSMAVEGLLQQE